MRRLIIHLGQFWDRIWFSETQQYQYGIFRVILFAVLVFQLFLPSTVQIEGLEQIDPPQELIQPSFAIRWLPVPKTFSLPLLLVFALTLRLSAIFALIGCWTRPALVITAFSWLYVHGMICSWGAFDHESSLMALVLVILPFTPGINTLSLDAWRVKRRARRASAPHLANWTRHTAFPVWPAHLILLLLSLVYFTSGLSKVRHGSWRWLDGQTLKFYLAGETGPYFTSDPYAPVEAKFRDGVGLACFVYDVRQQTSLGRRLAQSDALMCAFSIGTFLIEFTFPLVLISKRARYVYFPAAALMHFSIMILMPPLNFMRYVLVYALFVDWRRVRSIWQRLRPSAQEVFPTSTQAKSHVSEEP